LQPNTSQPNFPSSSLSLPLSTCSSPSLREIHVCQPFGAATFAFTVTITIAIVVQPSSLRHSLPAGDVWVFGGREGFGDEEGPEEPPFSLSFLLFLLLFG